MRINRRKSDIRISPEEKWPQSEWVDFFLSLRAESNGAGMFEKWKPATKNAEPRYHPSLMMVMDNGSTSIFHVHILTRDINKDGVRRRPLKISKHHRAFLQKLKAGGALLHVIVIFQAAKHSDSEMCVLSLPDNGDAPVVLRRKHIIELVPVVKATPLLQAKHGLAHDARKEADKMGARDKALLLRTELSKRVSAGDVAAKNIEAIRQAIFSATEGQFSEFPQKLASMVNKEIEESGTKEIPALIEKEIGKFEELLDEIIDRRVLSHADQELKLTPPVQVPPLEPARVHR